MRLESVILGLVHIGCGGPSDTDTAPIAGCDPEATVEIGTGVTEFESITELGPLVIVHGPQGGYHLPGALRSCAMAEGSQIVHWTAVHEESGAVVTDVTYDRLSRPDGACCGTITDLFGYLTLSGTGYYTDPAAFLDGDIVLLTMVVTDAVGVEATGTLRVVAQAPVER